MNPIVLNLIIFPQEDNAEEIIELIKDHRTNMPIVNLLANDGRFLGKIKIERPSNLKDE